MNLLILFLRLTTDQNLLHILHGTQKVAILVMCLEVFAAAGVLLGNKVCVYTGAAIFNNKKKNVCTMQTAACLFSMAELFPTETICIKHTSRCDTYVNNTEKFLYRKRFLIMCLLDKLLKLKPFDWSLRRKLCL